MQIFSYKNPVFVPEILLNSLYLLSLPFLKNLRFILPYSDGYSSPTCRDALFMAVRLVLRLSSIIATFSQ